MTIKPKENKAKATNSSSRRRRGTSTNGNIRKKPRIQLPPLDADSLYTIFSFLNTQELVCMKQVSSQFNRVASSSALWKIRFLVDFCPDEPENEQDWHTLYLTTVHCIPRVMKKKPKKWTDVENEDLDEDDDGADQYWSEDYRFGVYYTCMKLDCSETMVTKHVHRLAGLLALLNVDYYVPSMFDMVRIGRVEDNRVIQLSQFCYSMLHGTDDQYYTVEEGEDVENTPAISPHIHGKFVPFVHYGKLQCKKGLEHNISNEVFPDTSIFDSIYHFKRSAENGFAPGFFNASFGWWYFVSVYTAYSKEGYIVAAKDKEGHISF
jgi:hypothetical protein